MKHYNMSDDCRLIDSVNLGNEGSTKSSSHQVKHIHNQHLLSTPDEQVRDWAYGIILLEVDFQWFGS